jgi:hypothetical protein
MTLDEDLAARGLPALKGPGHLMRLAEAGAAVTLTVGDSQHSRGGGRRTNEGWGRGAAKRTERAGVVPVGHTSQVQ